MMSNPLYAYMGARFERMREGMVEANAMFIGTELRKNLFTPAARV